MDKPKIKLQPSMADRALDIVGWVALAYTWFYLYSHFNDLPDQVPIHFNGAGEADEYGARTTLIFTPLIATMLYAFMTFLNRNPHLFNLPGHVQPHNIEWHYRLTSRLIRVLKLGLVVIFFYANYSSITIAKGQALAMPRFFLVIVVAMFLIPVITYLILASRKK
jgi:hypothetical protein